MANQLRVKTEYNFGEAFGKLTDICETLKDTGCNFAAIVDKKTFGHVKWQAACVDYGINPGFGLEFAIKYEDKEKNRKRAPISWVIAEDLRQFYQFSSKMQSDPDEEKLDQGGIIRFCGQNTGLDPDLYDFVDINPQSDIQTHAALEIVKRTGKPLVLTSFNIFPSQKHVDAGLAIDMRRKISNQFLISNFREQFRFLSDDQFVAAMRNANEIAERAAHSLNKAEMIKTDGDLNAILQAGIKKRIDAGLVWNDEYQNRTEKELKLIFEKNFQDYFIVVADLVCWAKTKMLVGPGRGSSAGSLICYLLGITEVDSIKHGLLFERFIDPSRSDLPDIDIDFNDKKRDQCYDYLREKYGNDNVARLGNVNKIMARSVINRSFENLYLPEKEKYYFVDNVLIDYPGADIRREHSIADSFETDAGAQFLTKYPQCKLWTQIEGHASHAGVHAAGVIVSSESVTEFCSVVDGIAQIDKPDAEFLNLLKIDALGLSTLGILEDAAIAAGVDVDTFYNVDLSNDEVYHNIFQYKRFCGIFQFEGAAMRDIAGRVDILDFKRIDHITALARPGPMQGGASANYVKRANSIEPVKFPHEKVAHVLSDTFGVIVYQEQVMQICQLIGNFDIKDTNFVRKAISLRKGPEYLSVQAEKFVIGAILNGLSEENARLLWDEIIGFGAYGMNRAHTCSYAIVSFWCAYAKHYFTQHYAVAALNSIDDDDKTLQLLRELRDDGINYVPFDVFKSEINWCVKDGTLYGGFRNLEGVGPAKAATFVQQRNADCLDVVAISEKRVKFASVQEIRDRFGHIIDDPENNGISDGSRFIEISKIPEVGDVLVIAKVADKKTKDMNSPEAIKRRGKALRGVSIVCDLYLTDDSGCTITARIDRFDYDKMKSVADCIEKGDFVMLRASRIPGFNMITIKRDKLRVMS